MAVCGGICWDASQRVYRGSRCPLALTMRCKDARAGQSSPAFHWKPLVSTGLVTTLDTRQLKARKIATAK